MKMSELRPLLMGKTISYYSGWSGSSDYFKIGYMKKTSKTSVQVFQTKGKGCGVFIPFDAIPELLKNGIYIIKDEIERCQFTITYKLF